MTIRALLVSLLSVTAASADLPMIGSPPKPSPVIAEGPLEVVVIPWNASAGRADPPVAGLLFRVAEGHAIYHRLNKLGETVICEPTANPPRNPVVAIKAKAGGQVWMWDTARKRFTGPKITQLASELTAANVPADEARHLYFAYGRLAERLDTAIVSNDMPTVAELARRAETLAGYMERKKLDPAVRRLYAGVTEYSAGFARRKADSADLYAAAAKDEAELKSAASAAQQKAAAAQMAGLFTALVGAYGKPDGHDLYKFSDGSVESVERRVIDPETIMSGVAGMAQAQASLMAEKARFNRARQLLKADLAAKLDVLAKADRDARRDRVIAYKTVGTSFGLVGEWPLNPDRSADEQTTRPELTAMEAVYKAQARFERGTSGPDNPFRVADVCGWAAATATEPAKVLSAAETCAAAVGLVPSDPIHDRDRVELLARAAGLANAAAWKHVGSRYLDTAYHPYSLTARRLAEAAGEYNQVADTEGLLREQMMYALAGCGELDKAAALASQLGDLRANHLAFQFQTARVLAASGKTADAATCLRRAFAAGLPRKSAVDNADIRHASGRGPVGDTLAIRVDPVVEPGNRLSQLAVTNKSAFPLTGVKLKLTTVVPGRGQLEFSLTADDIQPGETKKWPVALPAGSGKRALRGNTADGPIEAKTGF